MHTPVAARSVTSIVSPDDQRVTFVELFFDLVFVFCVTQTVSLFHHALTFTTVGQALLIFWLVWWAWTQFTWALNAADTTHAHVGIGTLIATAIAFFMAVAIPNAFHGGALWFALPYIAVRAFGLTLYGWVADEADSVQRAAVHTFTLVSATGLVAVLIGGIVSGPLQYWAWGGAILLDIMAAMVGGRQEGWNLHPEHFAERHGLFVIIALGETLIVAAGGLTSAALTPAVMSIATLAVATTCALWWTYFVRAKPALDHALETQTGTTQTMMARDVFSLIHFPMVWGIIAYAVMLEEAIRHPTGPTPLGARLALASGIALFVGGMVAAAWRATGRLLRLRLVVTLIIAAAILVLDGANALTLLALALAGLVVIAVWEQRPGVHRVGPHDAVQRTP